MTLYLIRHAHAGQRDPDDPQDDLRPLSAKGRRQAETLAAACSRLELTFDRLFSSPYTRAVQTAEPLIRHATHGTFEPLSDLATDACEALLIALQHTLKEDDRRVALVGHEPYLSEFASFLLTGDARRLRLHVRKGMMVELGGPLEAGKLELQSAFTSKHLALIAA